MTILLTKRQAAFRVMDYIAHVDNIARNCVLHDEYRSNDPDDLDYDGRCGWFFEDLCTPQEWLQMGILTKLDQVAYDAEFKITRYMDDLKRLMTIEEAEALLEEVFSHYKRHETPKLVMITDAVATKHRVALRTAGFAHSDSNTIYIRPADLTMDVILHEAAHILNTTYCHSVAHGRDFRKKRDILLKRHAKIKSMALPDWTIHARLMEALEDEYVRGLRECAMTTHKPLSVIYNTRKELDEAQKKLDAIRDKIRKWQSTGEPQEKRAALEKALLNQTMKMLPLETTLKEATAEHDRLDAIRKAFLKDARRAPA